MNLRQAVLRLAHRYRPRTTAAVVGLVLVCLLALRIVVSGALLYREAVDDWKQDLSNLSLLLAENTAQSMTAARLVEPLGGWRRYKPELGALMKQELERIAASEGLSKNVHELVAKALAD